MIKRIERAFDLTYDLATNLQVMNLKLKLKDLPSNEIGQQFWCIIGARESYLKAIINGMWSGFSCALKDTSSKEDILNLLNQTKSSFVDYLTKHTLSEDQMEMLLDLLEHEIQHHGQLIRYIYGNKLKFPESWHNRYTV